MKGVTLKRCGCTPTAYAPGSSLVHGSDCDTPEKALTSQERREFLAALNAFRSGHPTSRPAYEPIRSVPMGVSRSDRLHTCSPSCGCDYALEGIPLAKHR